MQIAFSHHIFTMQRAGGVSRYFYELAKQFTKRTDLNFRLLSPIYFNDYLSSGTRSIASIHGHRVGMNPATTFLARQLNSILSRFIAPPSLDVYHQTYYTKMTTDFRGAARIVTVFDMIHELYPGMFANGRDTTDAKRASVRAADHVICISESTRRDLVNLFGIPLEKTSVVHLASGLAADFPGGCSAADAEDYLLFVGSRSIYKNFDRLLQAFACSSARKAGTRIICFGGLPFEPQELNAIAKLGVADLVEHRAGGDDTLVSLYRNAKALVYPSLHEGFGLPILEAMSLDCPVICSHSSSIPEVAGDAAQYFDPLEVDSIRGAIDAVVCNELRGDTLRLAGQQQSSRFSWARCAGETLAAYEASQG